MKIREHTEKDADGQESREEMRELAEALSLYRSAMRHVAEKQAERPIVLQTRSATAMRVRLFAVPALALALAVAVIVPTYSHLHNKTATTGATAAGIVQPTPPQTVASVDDAQLMNQIDSDLTEDVPDALQPLADLSDSATTNKSSVTEKK
jgi:hypothetical protein